MSEAPQTAVEWAQQSPEHALKMLKACSSAIQKLRDARERTDERIVINLTNLNEVKRLCYQKGWPVQ